MVVIRFLKDVRIVIFIQLILEYFSEGIEHGHIHVHHKHKATFPVAMMAGLCIHSFLEGMPLAGSFSHDHHNHSLLAGILLHHLPVAIALALVLQVAKASGLRVWTHMVGFAAAAPLGILTGRLIGEQQEGVLNAALGIALGMFLHITTTIIFESSKEHRIDRARFATVIAGAFLAWMFVH